MAAGGTDDAEELKNELERDYPNRVEVLLFGHEVKKALERISESSLKAKGNTSGGIPSGPDIYEFSKPKLGLAVIINNNFQGRDHERYAAPKDVKALCKTFTNYGFDVLVCLNFHAKEMIDVLSKVAEMEEYHKRADCFACVIMTHGDFVWKDKNVQSQRTERVKGDDDKEIDTMTLFEMFNDRKCPGLKGKLKLFFIQACRGPNRDHGVVAPGASGDTDAQLQNTGPADSYIPFDENLSYDDVVIMYASPPGYRSKRRIQPLGNTLAGSWFIQSLCQVLDEDNCPTVHLLHALTRVQAKVAQEFTGIPSGDKQMPMVDSRLLKDIYLPRKENDGLRSTNTKKRRIFPVNCE